MERRFKNKANRGKRKTKEEWRRYGAARRRELIAKDEVQGGTSFEMHKKCQIERYFRIAEKAIADFQKKCRDPKSDIEETYVMGHRLKAFLGKALPQHPNYYKSQVAQLRSKSLRQLEWVKEEMEDLALKIDEEHLNTYITMDFDPLPDEFSTSSSEADNESGFADFSSCSMGGIDDTEWQAFTGWAFTGISPDAQTQVPLATETDSSRSHEISSSYDASDSDEQQSDDDKNKLDLDEDQVEVEEEMEEPKTYVTFQDDGDSDSDDEIDLDDRPSEFFRKIANETVNYESDSEAVDSWAQDGESYARSCASSGTALTYDPARIAFREIMNKVSKDRNQLCWQNGSSNRQMPVHSVSYLPPKSILTQNRRSEEKQVDSWATFNIASVRQERHRIAAKH
ncbi:hypothetical protein ACA910_019671 [Epithemia clementina (nom. ined.)]